MSHNNSLINENNNSKSDDENSLISDRNLPSRKNFTKADKRLIASFMNQAYGVVKDKLMNFEEISVKKPLFFRVFVTGTIEDAKFNTNEPLKVKYEFVAGQNWELEDGLSSSESQFSSKGIGSYENYSFSQHFEVNYRSINPYGWPQIVLNFSTVDENGKDMVVGFGCVHVPASVGIHKRKVNIFQTIESESASGIFTKIFGLNIAKTNDISSTPKVISSGQGREISRVSCLGTVNLVFQVSFRDMRNFGLVVK